MGVRTDAKIAAWQEQSGIEPATGKRAELLGKLSQAAFEAIKIIELELSGIRDGDGYWHGSDAMYAVIRRVAVLCEDIEPCPF